MSAGRFKFVARRRMWFAISAALVAISIAAMGVLGFNFGIEFKGGATFQFAANEANVEEVTKVLEENGLESADTTVQEFGDEQLRVTTPPLTNEEATALQEALASVSGNPIEELSPSTVGASWGGEITEKALQALLIFLLAVGVYISLRFEPKMAAAALVALAHDLIITAGVYALVGFEVTPATVIALLTVLGFSLYDTIVVFDKVKENTENLSGGQLTYAQQANLALNQTLARSINTSIIALIPVAALLFFGAGVLGVGTLADLALAQFVGLAAGTYSSIFLATPLLVKLREKDEDVVEHDERLRRRLSSERKRSQKPASSEETAPAAPARPAARRSGQRTQPQRTNRSGAKKR